MEDTRYDRQLLLPEVGEGGQKKIRQASALLVGVGGLGSPIAMYLTGAGIGRLGLMDDDVVSITNLHRQVLYGTDQVGQAKVKEAEARLHNLNPEVTLETYPHRLTADNAEDIVSRYDMIIDGCDNFATRFLLDDVCRKLRTPYIYGAVCGFYGQASVFHQGPAPHSYRELYPDEEATLAMPHPGKGVVGMTPAVIGSVMATQVLQLICSGEPCLSGKLWTMDLRDMTTNLIDL